VPLNCWNGTDNPRKGEDLGRIRNWGTKPLTPSEAGSSVKSAGRSTVARPAWEVVMLSAYSPVPALAVKDLAAARSFYEETLGFAPGKEESAGIAYTAGSGQFLVYESSFAGTNKATAMAFEAPDGDFDTEIQNLRDKGVQFQTFDMEGIEWDDDVAKFGEARAVWFSDPDGNILSLGTSMM
jgi:catechol 2,3-dioxygenase-like lactoylglutathione lyase family enzyme